MSHKSIKQITGIKEGVTATTGLAQFYVQSKNLVVDKMKIKYPKQLSFTGKTNAAKNN